MLIDVFVPIVGLALLIVSAQRTSFSQQLSMKMRACLVIAVSIVPLILVLGRFSTTQASLIIGACAVCLKLAASRKWRRQREISLEEALRALDLALLSMKAGRSLRTALRETIGSDATSEVSRVLQNMIDRLEAGGGETLPGVAGELLAEFRAIEKRGTRATESVESLRAQLRLRSEFRHKSRQVTLQARAQAGLAALLYAPLLAWHLFGGAWADPRVWFSCALFAGAQFWIHLLSRRFQWTV